MNPLNFSQFGAWLVPILIWTLFWKGWSLWTAAKNSQKGWFVALLVINTIGILEIIYLFGVAKKKWSDVTNMFGNLFPKSSPPAPPAQ